MKASLSRRCHGYIAASVLALILTTPLGGGAVTDSSPAASPAAARVRSQGGVVTSVKRALLVGINTYEPDAEDLRKLVKARKEKPSARPPQRCPQDLDGCVNDVEAMRALLVSKFGFKSENIVVLTNRAASREAILGGIERHLVRAGQPNDLALFYYAGHGSQVVNSKSDEPDRKDETIVPADSWSGAPDIRDKELRPLFNSVLDRGVVLTLIFDSCHSGSTARGVPVFSRSRHALPVMADIADAKNYGPSPEERGALILSAAQDDQEAKEDNSGSEPHGAFTAALTKVLRHSTANRTAAEIFQSLNSILQSSTHNQIPVLAGSVQRRRSPLFGGHWDLSGRTIVAVSGINSDGTIQLQGGSALGLNPGCQLRSSSGVPGASSLLLELINVESLTASTAKIVSGTPADVQSGDVFEVSRWTFTPEAMLRVWIPPAAATPALCSEAVKLVVALRATGKIAMVEDPTVVAPTHMLAWDGAQWLLSAGQKRVAAFGELPAPATLMQKLAGSPVSPKLFVSIPPPPELRAALSRPERNSAALQTVENAAAAHYVLMGTARGSRASYAWVMPNADATSSQNSALPISTHWLPTNNLDSISWADVGRNLNEAGVRIGRIRAWLSLEAPEDEGQFPYRLGLRNIATRKIIKAETSLATQPYRESRDQKWQAVLPQIRGGETYETFLYADPDRLLMGVEKRFVYLFVISTDGSLTLLWPPDGIGNSQRLPVAVSGSSKFKSEISLNSKLSIIPPYGVDTYVLLTSATDIPDASVLESDGVRSGSRSGSASDPLQILLESVGSSTRGARVVVPAGWSIQRLTVRSVAP